MGAQSSKSERSPLPSRDPERDVSAAAGRGSSVQGPMQDAKGGPQGASQGGAPRGGSRVEPSHIRERMKQDRAGAKSPRKS